MRREITQKFLGEVADVGRFVMGIGLGGFIGWACAVSAASPDAHLHLVTVLSIVLLLVTMVGASLWVFGAIIKPDLPPGPPGPQGPTGPTGPAGQFVSPEDQSC